MAAQCGACASRALTEISITMTDGSVVDFTSCHACESKSYRSAGELLPLDRVLSLAARRK
ncbi:MAG TPA: hypothetical protein VNB94_09105 [Mycobacteriales bacterium]|nr:hypothetical protein [Mycobacteriales bacterium]